MRKFTNRRRSRKRNVAFVPDRAYIEAAIQEFFESGGRINYVESDEKSFKYFVSVNDPDCVDDYLMGD